MKSGYLWNCFVWSSDYVIGEMSEDEAYLLKMRALSYFYQIFGKYMQISMMPTCTFRSEYR